MKQFAKMVGAFIVAITILGGVYLMGAGSGYRVASQHCVQRGA